MKTYNLTLDQDQSYKKYIVYQNLVNHNRLNHMLNVTHKKNRSRKNGGIDGKALRNLMNNASYSEAMKNVRKRIDIRLVSNKKDYLKWTSKPSHM